LTRHDDVLSAACRRWCRSFGAGSRRELETRARAALELADEDAEALVAELEQEHVGRYGARRLAAELDDERERDAAVADDRALVLYERKWARRLAKLQRRHAARWCLAGLSAAELRDELTLRLIGALRSAHVDRARYERAGKEWGLVLFTHERRALRRNFRLNVVLAEPPLAFGLGATQEERLLEHEHATLLARAEASAESTLTRPQQRWYAAMRDAANAGGFFETSGKLNLAAVSRARGRNRSSATRAFHELETVFARELEKLGYTGDRFDRS
jgi:hypothetical protein